MEEKDKNSKNVSKNGASNNVIRMMSVVRDAGKCNKESHGINNELNKWPKSFSSPENNRKIFIVAMISLIPFQELSNP